MSIGRSGPVALGRTAFNVVALAVDTTEHVRAATRLIGGGSWTPLFHRCLAGRDQSARRCHGGHDRHRGDGYRGWRRRVVCSAISVDGLIWSPLVPLP